MDSNIYYSQNDLGLLITSNFEKIKKNMALGIFPKTDFIEISIDKVDELTLRNVTLNEVDNELFQSIKSIFYNRQFTITAFHSSTLDISNVFFNTQHLVIGDKCKINLAAKNFKNLKEITFLSLKTFKGKILDIFENVEKLILWYESQRSNDVLGYFPNLKEFHIYNGSIVELNLTANPVIEKLQLHRVLKLEKVILPEKKHLKNVIVESCSKLDTSNLNL